MTTHGFRRTAAAAVVTALTVTVSVATAEIPARAAARASDDPVLVGAGDISDSGSGDSATAALLDSIPGTVFTLGDNVYDSGTAEEFSEYYAPTWGRHRSRTRPAPGNHDYETSGASGYFGYFGSLAGAGGKGYYSYDLGSWHVVALNSNVSMSAGSAQEKWLRADLAASGAPCTLAYWHHPLFTSGANHGPTTATRPLFQALYDAGAEVVVTGHNHQYERFAPLTPAGRRGGGRAARTATGSGPCSPAARPATRTPTGCSSSRCTPAATTGSSCRWPAGATGTPGPAPATENARRRGGGRPGNSEGNRKA